MRTARLIVVIAAALLAAGWFWWKYFRRPEQFTDRGRLFPAVLAIGLLCRLAFVFFTPPFDAPDEPSHFNYIRYLAEHHSLPVQRYRMDTAYQWEFSQPPVYYVAMTPLFLMGKTIFRGYVGALFAVRLGSVLLWLLNVWFGLIVLKRLQIADKLMRSFVLALICLLPTYTFVSSVINNDNLLATIGGAILCLMLERARSVRGSLALGLVLGLAFLTKQSAVVFAPAIVLLFILDGRERRRHWSSALLHVFLVLGPALLLCLPWALRNWRIYGLLAPESLSVARLSWASSLIGLTSAVHNLVKTFWSVSGFSNNVGYPFPIAGFIFLWLCIIWREPHPSSLPRVQPAGDATPPFTTPIPPKPDFLNRSLNRPFLSACLLAIAVNILLVLRLGYLFGMGQGRHLFPLLYPIALFLAARWRTFPAKNLEPYTTGIWIMYALGFLVFSIWCFPVT